MTVSAILLMGGEGKRFSSPVPKQFTLLQKVELFLYPLKTILHTSFFHEVILVCHKDWIEHVQKQVSTYPFVRVVEGGDSRQQSSYLGLKACSKRTKYVMIHDAVRPFLTKRIIRENLDAVKVFYAVDTCIPSADTIVHSKNQQVIQSIPQRCEYLRGQTPQTFFYPLILQAHEQMIAQGKKNATDDCQLILSIGKKVGIVMGSEENMKITHHFDLVIARELLKKENETCWTRTNDPLLKREMLYRLS